LGKLKVLSGKDVCNILSLNGFIMIHQKGNYATENGEFNDHRSCSQSQRNQNWDFAIYNSTIKNFTGEL